MSWNDSLPPGLERTPHLGTWYTARLQPPTRGIDLEKRNRRTLSMNLHGRAVYQPYRWLDGDSKAWLETATAPL